MARSRVCGQRKHGGKSPRVRIVCTSPAPASDTSTEATETVQALSPQKRQYNGSDLTLGGICKRCCRLITAYNKAREELERLEAAAADDDGHARTLQEAQQMVAAKLAAVKDCEAQIKRGATFCRSTLTPQWHRGESPRSGSRMGCTTWGQLTRAQLRAAVQPPAQVQERQAQQQRGEQAGGDQGGA